MTTSNRPTFGIPQAAQSNSALATASMILGILGWTLLPILGAIIAVITGHMAKSEIRKSNGQLGGEGMATAGLILGYTSIVLGICVCAAVILIPALGSGVWLYGDQFLNPVP